MKDKQIEVFQKQLHSQDKKLKGATASIVTLMEAVKDLTTAEAKFHAALRMFIVHVVMVLEDDSPLMNTVDEWIIRFMERKGDEVQLYLEGFDDALAEGYKAARREFESDRHDPWIDAFTKDEQTFMPMPAMLALPEPVDGAKAGEKHPREEENKQDSQDRMELRSHRKRSKTAEPPSP